MAETVKDLRAKAKAAGIKGYSKMRKAQLEEALDKAEGYDAADNAAKCYTVAIAHMRSKLESFRKEVIGDCTLYLGDCREILPLLAHHDAVVTDPPYGMEFRSNYRAVKHAAIANDDAEWPLQLAVSIPVSHSSYVFCRWDNLWQVQRPKSLVTWVKNNWSMGDLNHEHARQTEVVLFYAGPRHDFPDGRPTDVFDGRRTGNDWHPTEKPVDLMRNVVSWTRGAVLDPFMGSGTTGVACVKSGRRFTGIEINEGHFETACRRIREAYKQPDMFVPAPTTPIEQLSIIAAE